MHSWWSMKSNSTSKAPDPYGTAEVVSPRGLTYSVTCHQWLIIGACARRTLPTIWLHMCRVSLVSAQSATRSCGHASRVCAVCCVTVVPSGSASSVFGTGRIPFLSRFASARRMGNSEGCTGTGVVGHRRDAHLTRANGDHARNGDRLCPDQAGTRAEPVRAREVGPVCAWLCSRTRGAQR